MKSRLFYYLIKTLTLPISFLPLKVVRFIGKIGGSLAYLFLKEFRKTALSNLALAKPLSLSHKELIKTARGSFINLAINILEYAYLDRKKNLHNLFTCHNFAPAQKLAEQKKGIIFFCGHQSNWEVLFLHGNLHMQGVAIGKPIKNPYLYQWIVSIREKTGGKIIEPKKALKEGLRALKKGLFMGILADQGMPNSTFSHQFMGRMAWSTTAPALLSYKTGCPIIVATTKRSSKGYDITYSDPIYPNNENSLDNEVDRLMGICFSKFESSIIKNPKEWLWLHNRWKQQTPKNIYKPYRKDALAIILPEDQNILNKVLPDLNLFKQLYPYESLFVFAPKKLQKKIHLNADEIIFYKSQSELFRKDFRFKLIFNFTDNKKIEKYYKKLAATTIVEKEKLVTSSSFSKQLVKLICRHPEEILHA